MANMNNKKIRTIKKLEIDIGKEITQKSLNNEQSSFMDAYLCVKDLQKRNGCGGYTSNGLYHGRRGKTYNSGK